MKALLKAVVVSLLFVTGTLFHVCAQTVSSTKTEPGGTTPISAPDLDLTVSSTQAWTDTGLELHPGDVLELSSSTAPPSAAAGVAQPVGFCDVNSASANSSNDLQLQSAPLGALIAKLHSQGGEPFFVGEKKEVKIEEQSHLFLGVNAGTAPVCQRTITVKVHLVSATTGQTTTPPKDIKSKLAAAAQTWIAGQFGTGNAGSNAPAANETSRSGTNAAASTTTPPAISKPLNISTGALDPKLRDVIDHLPRRVNDQLRNLGDMVNFVMIGSQKDVQNALQAANWFVADTSNTGAVTKAILMTYEKKDYLQMPMSQLYLFGRVQDFGYEQAEPYAVVASRHHFRLWKAPFQVDGQEVWVGAGTHDVGFEKDRRNGNVTHKIDPAVDGERDHIAASMEKTGLVKTLNYYLPPDPVQQAKNATGGGYHSDGRVAVMWIVPNKSAPGVTAGRK
jgi:LssY-like putative type I secretion system component LssY